MEDGPLIGGPAGVAEVVDQPFGRAQAVPAAVDAVFRRVHGAADGGVYEVGHAAPGLGAEAVKGNREDDFLGVVVVGEEQVAVVGLQRVPCCDDLVALGDAIRVLCRPGIHLGVEVQLGEEGPGSGFVGPSVFVGTRGRQIGFDSQQLRLDVFEKIGAGNLFGDIRTDGVLIRHKGDIAVEVEGVVVAQGAQEAGLGAVGFDIGRIGAGYTAFCELGIAGLADELIADRDLVIDPVVERFEEGVACRPVHIVEVPDIGVVPGDDGFIGGELLGLPVLAQVLREALVNTADIRFAGRALLAGHGEAQVQAG